ncbi:MAG: C10 family peptidase, partial [Prevotellaceae bacterium]|nr:C10 family peptidase [Prevotellaceae bacterium]
MKKTLLLLTVLLVSVTISASEIPLSKAKEKALSFVASFDNASSLGATGLRVKKSSVSTAELNLSYTAKTAEKKDFYVFNLSANNGFVIVSADDIIGETVIGYSDYGNFNYDELPANAKWWLSQYSDQIEAARRDGVKTIPATTVDEPYEVVIPPLLGDITWGQSAPFNTYTPTLDGDKCVTGCVATAMSQVMFFHCWPLQGKGSHSYKWEKGNKTLTADFSQSVYEWNNIIPSYVSYTTEQGNAVARVMVDAGYAVDMNYGPSSGAIKTATVTAYKSYFSYSSDVKYKTRTSSTTDISWNQTIKENLNAFRPLLYGGSSGEGAHAFVCDGYASGDYFHFNFGWNGSGNGYFLSSVAGKYSKSQNYVYGIHPADDANRILVDGINYNILGNGEVQVAYSPRQTYAGDIEIPSKVNIQGETYTVTRIAPVAFAKCKSLTSVTIPSTVKLIGGNSFFGCDNLSQIEVLATTPPTAYGTTFDSQTVNHVQLVVPNGTRSQYLSAAGWKLFPVVVDESGSSDAWGEWEDFGYGVGRYVQTSLFTSDKVFDDLPVKIRSSKTDPNTCQVLVEGWGYSTTQSLVIGFDRLTNKCTVAKQLYGYRTSDGKVVYVSDMPTLSKSYTYSQYPCTYDPEKGIFKLYVSYGSKTWSGVDTLTVQGAAADYRLSLSSASEVTELDNDTASQTFSFNVGKDIASLRYALVKETLSEDQIADYSANIVNGEYPYVELQTTEASNIDVKYPTSGKYVFILVGLQKDGLICAMFSQKQNYTATKNWHSIGTAPYHEDLVANSVYPKIKEYDYKVEVEKNTLHSGLYRIKNPYGTAYTMNTTGKYTVDDCDVYLEINATDPDAVYISHNQDMNVAFNAKHGEMYVSSVAGKAIAEGSTLADEKVKGTCGKLANSVITFPIDMLLVRYPLYSADWVSANNHGTFSLDLTG